MGLSIETGCRLKSILHGAFHRNGLPSKIDVYMIVNRRLLFLENEKRKEKDMKIITNVDAINSQIFYYSFFGYGSIFPFILVDLIVMFVCHLRKLWTQLIPESLTKRGK